MIKHSETGACEQVGCTSQRAKYQLHCTVHNQHNEVVVKSEHNEVNNLTTEMRDQLTRDLITCYQPHPSQGVGDGLEACYDNLLRSVLDMAGCINNPHIMENNYDPMPAVAPPPMHSNHHLPKYRECGSSLSTALSAMYRTDNDIIITLLDSAIKIRTLMNNRKG